MGVIDARPVPRPYGSFGFQPVAGLIEPDPSATFTPGRTVMGLANGPQYVYGSFRSPDTGRYYGAMRNFNGEVAAYFMLYEGGYEGRDHEDWKYVAESHEAYRGLVDYGARDGRWGTWRPDRERVFSYLCDEQRSRWTEGDFLDLEGRLFGNYLQMAIPDARSPWVYTSRLYQVSGTVRGDEVEGFYWHETMNTLPGMGFLQSEYYHRLDAAWVAFVTEFEDGNTHAGHLIWGPDNFSLVVVQATDRDPVVASGISLEIELDGGHGKRLSWEVSPDEIWDWNTLMKMPELPMMGANWSQGVVTRRGETREWADCDGWIDVFPDRLEGARIVS